MPNRLLAAPAYQRKIQEAEMKRLENLEKGSVLKSDSATPFDKIWSSKMVVITPANEVGTVEGTKQHFRTGGVNYLSFKRDIEKITFNDDVAIVMGSEVIKPQGSQPYAGKTVTRRFTPVGRSYFFATK